MDWGTLAGTALGALLGVGSTLLVDRARAGRERAQRSEQLRRQVYGDYLLALTRTRIGLRDIVHDAHATPRERVQRADEAIREGHAYALRHQLQLCAPQRLVTLTDRAHAALRDLRESAGSAVSPQDPQYLAARAAYEAATTELRAAMRQDLHAPER